MILIMYHLTRARHAAARQSPVSLNLKQSKKSFRSLILIEIWTLKKMSKHPNGFKFKAYLRLTRGCRALHLTKVDLKLLFTLFINLFNCTLQQNTQELYGCKKSVILYEMHITLQNNVQKFS